MARPQKKVVLFLVEGRSEQEALFVPISKIYHEIDPQILIRFQMMIDRDKHDRSKIHKSGDITSKYGVKEENIEKLMNELFFYPFFSANYIYPKDILEVVHIVDMDGAFIPPEAVVEDLDVEDITYTDTAIYTNKRDLIIERNERKQVNLIHLSQINKIKAKTKTVPYSVYYMSCNLDHFLHGERNMADHLKSDYAKEFSRKCSRDMQLFYDTFHGEGCVTEMDYTRSWDFIKQEKNSLNAYTNLNILIDRLCSQAASAKDSLDQQTITD